MNKTVMSTKGQVVIPKALRTAKGLEPGVALEIVEHPEGVLLKIARKAKTGSIMDLFGILKPHYSGPPITIEQMNQAVEDAAVERYQRSIRDRD
jgi:AbrB family looped-hinge helix DNA binding protein